MTVFLLIGCLGGICYLFELIYRILRLTFRPRKLKTFEHDKKEPDAPQGQKGGE